MKEFASASSTTRQAVTQALARHQQWYWRHFFHRQVIPRLEGEKVLALAAHPDDIAVGCGGSVIGLVQAGVEVRFVSFTDGRAATPSSSDQQRMAEVRATEEQEVAANLGIAAPLLLGCNENEFRQQRHQEHLIAVLGKVLDEFEPDSILVPYLFDMHPDHRYVNLLLAGALQRNSQVRQIYCYEVWSQVPPGIVVDISACLDRKKELIGLYRSQLELFDYLNYAETIGRFHAPLAGANATAAEAFCPFMVENYLESVTGLDFGDAEDPTVEVKLTPFR